MEGNFNLGLVIEHVRSNENKPYSYSKNGFLRSLEVETFIPDMVKFNSNTYLINILDDPIHSDGTITMLRASDDSEVRMPIDSLDVVYLGNTGQKMYIEPEFNSLASNLEKICSFLDVLDNYPSVKVSNPKETMLKFVSKDYLFDLQDAKIPVSRHFPIMKLESMDDFDKIKQLSDDSGIEFVVKPLIAERGNGSHILSNLKRSEMKNLLDVHVNYDARYSKSPSYSQILSRQGLLAQPYNSDYLSFGEKKIFYVDGCVTLARRNAPENEAINKYNNTLGFRDNLQEVIYQPTLDELDFVENVASYLKSKNIKFDYFRLDIVGDGTKDRTFLNELELFNPCSSAGHDNNNPNASNPPYSDLTKQKHVMSLLNSFKKSDKIPFVANYGRAV